MRQGLLEFERGSFRILFYPDSSLKKTHPIRITVRFSIHSPEKTLSYAKIDAVISVYFCCGPQIRLAFLRHGKTLSSRFSMLVARHRRR